MSKAKTKRKLPEVTLEKMIAAEPCWLFEVSDPLEIIKNYEKMKRLFKGRKGVTALSILSAPGLSDNDRVWAACQFVPRAFINKVMSPYEYTDFNGDRHVSERDASDIFDAFEEDPEGLKSRLLAYVNREKVEVVQ